MTRATYEHSDCVAVTVYRYAKKTIKFLVIIYLFYNNPKIYRIRKTKPPTIPKVGTRVGSRKRTKNITTATTISNAIVEY